MDALDKNLVVDGILDEFKPLVKHDTFGPIAPKVIRPYVNFTE